jgi:hypothetical protein
MKRVRKSGARTNPGRGRELMKTSRSCPTKRTNHVNVQSRLVPPGGGRKRIARRMDEDDLGKVTRPKENAASDLTYLPN